MAAPFTPDYQVFNDVLGDETNYLIPSYQRPYSWDCLGRSDKNNQVNVMWDDLYEYFESGNKETYFMGSMVMIYVSSREYEVIDGQQRLTSILLLFAAIKCVLRKRELRNELYGSAPQEQVDGFFDQNMDDIERLIFNRTIRPGIFLTGKKVRIQRGVGFDFDSILDAALNCQDRSSLMLPTSISAEDRVVVDRYFDNLQYFMGRVEEKFAPENRFSNESLTKLSDFLAFIRFRIGVIRIIASSFNAAYQVFEILNNRGLPLSNVDLLRNFIIREFAVLNETSPGRCPDPAAKWHALETDNELDNAFISRYVESINAKKQRYSAFNDLKEIYDRNYQDRLGKAKIEWFYDDFQAEVCNYTKIVRFQFQGKELNNRLQFLLLLPNPQMTINILLAASRKDSNEEKLLDFSKALEVNTIFRMAFGERAATGFLFDFVIKKLNVGLIDDTRVELSLKDTGINHIGIIHSWLVQSNFDNETAALLIAKYIWAKEAAMPLDDVAKVELILDHSTLEHIIPQKPAPGTNWLTDFSEDFRKEYTYKLGNFTLLTHRMNSAAKNFDFSKKQEIYKKTRLPITQEMTVPGFQMTEAYIRERHERICKVILADLGL